MGKKILLIEDNEQNRYLVRFFLQKHGYEVMEANSGPEGIESAERTRPSLIILDIQLPGMDGYSVARRLNESSLTKGIPILMVTSYAMAGDREKGIAAGASGYVEKPIDPETFLAEVEGHLLRLETEKEK